MGGKMLTGERFGITVLAVLLGGCLEQPAPVGQSAAPAANPCEWIGEAHNEGLAFVLDRLAGKEKIATTDIAETVDTFLRENLGRYSMGKGAIAGLDWGEIIRRSAGGRATTRESLAELAEDGTATDAFHALALRISALVVQEEWEALTDLEREIPGVGLPGTEEAGLLAGIAVARHSYEFWSTRIPVGRAKTADLLPVVVADAQGAMIGAVIGSFGGPAGSLAGSVAGAVCASAGVAL